MSQAFLPTHHTPEEAERKFSTALQERLQQAPSGANDVIIMLERLAVDTESEELRPEKFPNRKAYKRELLRRKQALMEERVLPVREKIERLGLILKEGGELFAMLATQGNKEQLLQVAALEEVEDILLDEDVPVHGLAEHS